MVKGAFIGSQYYCRGRYISPLLMLERSFHMRIPEGLNQCKIDMWKVQALPLSLALGTSFVKMGLHSYWVLKTILVLEATMFALPPTDRLTLWAKDLIFESSFSPLISIGRLGQLLYFDELSSQLRNMGSYEIFWLRDLKLLKVS